MSNEEEYYLIQGKISVLKSEVIEYISGLTGVIGVVIPYVLIKEMFERDLLVRRVEVKIYDMIDKVDALEKKLNDLDGSWRI